MRPPSAKEIKEENQLSVYKTSDSSLQLKTSEGFKNFTFDAVVGDQVDQEMLFRSTQCSINYGTFLNKDLFCRLRSICCGKVSLWLQRMHFCLRADWKWQNLHNARRRLFGQPGCTWRLSTTLHISLASVS